MKIEINLTKNEANKIISFLDEYIENYDQITEDLYTVLDNLRYELSLKANYKYEVTE